VDEEGQQIERVIPKSEFRKKVIIFPLDNESEDPDLGWLVHALPDMLSYDLTQDIYLNIQSVFSFFESNIEEGYPDLTGVPMTLKKKIAADRYFDYFTVGLLGEVEGQPSIKISLHNTRTTKLLAERTFSGNDIFPLTDEMAVWLKEALDLPQMHIENAVDLPISEILTGSVSALQHMYAGFNEYIFMENRDEGLGLIEKAVRKDSTFAYAYIHLYVFYLFNNQMEESTKALQAVMKYIHKLPEQIQFSMKHAYYYQVKQDPQMSLELAKNWAELYPDDLQAHTILGMRYMILGQKENELSAYKKILSLDPSQYEYLLQIGDIYKGQGKFNESLEYYQLYADEFPNNTKSFVQLGELYRTYGDYEQAQSYFNKALLIEADDISIQLSLARINTELGNFNQAVEEYQDILEQCSSPVDRYEVYRRMENHYFLRGQLDKGIESMEHKLAEREKYDAPINVLGNKIDAVERYASAGKMDTALQIIEIFEELGPPLDHLASVGYLIYYLELEDMENIAKYLPVAEKHIEEKQLGLIQHLIFFARARLYELTGEYESAIQEYTKVLDIEPANKSMHYQIGRCYRKQKDYREAEDHLLEILSVHPYWPEELYELGLIYHEWGKEDKALEYLNRSLTVWEEADPDYEPAARAKALFADLQANAH
jgi:tetratricopeptide (TPR) repeat protein